MRAAAILLASAMLAACGQDAAEPAAETQPAEGETAAAASAPAADTDKNESITALEIFNYANRAVEGFYETEKLLAPEHARLQGENAEAFEVARYGNLLAAKDAVPEELLATRETLANQVNILRARKDDLGEDEYFDALQDLMLRLSEVQREIDTANGQNGN